MMMCIKVTGDDVIVKGEKMVEEGSDSIVVNVSRVNSRRGIAVGDVKGWVGVYFGDDRFSLVYVW